MVVSASVPTRRPKVEFLKSGDVMGIRTTAATYEEFMQECAAELAVLIDNNVFKNDWEFQLSLWLPNIFELAAKLRGYKADVHEQRVLYAGSPFMMEGESVNSEGYLRRFEDDLAALDAHSTNEHTPDTHSAESPDRPSS